MNRSTLFPALKDSRAFLLRFNRQGALSLVKDLLKAANVSFKSDKDALEQLELQINETKYSKPLRTLLVYIVQGDVNKPLVLKKKELLEALKYGLVFAQAQTKNIFKQLGLKYSEVKASSKSDEYGDYGLIGAETIDDNQKQRLKDRGEYLLANPPKLQDLAAEDESFFLENSHKKFILNSLKVIDRTLSEFGNPSLSEDWVANQDLIYGKPENKEKTLNVRSLLEIRNYFQGVLDLQKEYRGSAIISKEEKEFFDSITDRKGSYEGKPRGGDQSKRRTRKKYYDIFSLKVLWAPDFKSLTDDLFQLVGLK